MPATRPAPHTGLFFDELVAVDWSAAGSPRTGADSIWIAHAAAAAGRPVRTHNPPTRATAHEVLVRLLSAALDGGRRVLVGVDFSLGYPSGFAHCTRRLGQGVGPPWRRTWDLLGESVGDGPDNANDRFAVADRINRASGTALFWGRPAGGDYEQLEALAPRDVVAPGLEPNPCPRLRMTERAAGPGIRSNFQLYGGVTVGGQVLTGIPYARRLHRQFEGELAVWPFETGFVADPLAEAPRRKAVRVVLCETWPSLFGRRLPPAMVRDEAQVRAAIGAWRRAQSAGWPGWFDPPARRAAPAAEQRLLVEEEGWILGVGAPGVGAQRVGALERGVGRTVSADGAAPDPRAPAAGRRRRRPGARPAARPCGG